MNLASLSKSTNIKPVVTALFVSPFASDHVALREIFSYLGWVLKTVSDCAGALAFLRHTPTPLVICERDLWDGTWKTILQASARMPEPPRFLVSSSLADSKLLHEMHDLGAYSVLASPPDSREIEVRVQLAWHSWQREWRNTRGVLLGEKVPSAEIGITAARVARSTDAGRGQLDFD